MIEQRRRTGSKRLRFSENSHLIITKAKSGEDIKNTWYSKRELARFKIDVYDTAKALRVTRTAKAIKYMARAATRPGSPQLHLHVHGIEHIRGLEHLISPEVFKSLWQRRQKAISRVLEDQQAQKKSGQSVDHTRLARVSEMNSAASREWSRRTSNGLSR